MWAPRSTVRHRRQRVRVVDVARRRDPPIPNEVAELIGIGLHGARLLKRHFRPFFDAHVADRLIDNGACHGGGILGVCVAFWMLVEQDGISLRPLQDEVGEMDWNSIASPVTALTCFDWVAAEWMFSVAAHYLSMPRPEYYGLGVQAVVEYGLELDDHLTPLLWHLFRHTKWGTGVNLGGTLSLTHAEEVLGQIERLTPLPPDTNVERIAGFLAIPEARGLVRREDLLGYAFGATGNELANHSTYEVEAVHYGETDCWSWSDLPELALLAQEARHIEEAYRAWNRRIASDMETEAPKLARALHRAARKARTVPQPKSLATLLVEAFEAALHAQAIAALEAL